MQLNVSFFIIGDECVSRKFGDSVVCVCNATYCDTISEPQLQQNQFMWYTSTRSGKRMELSVDNFSESGYENGVHLTVNSDEKYQKIEGFGGAMTDAAAINIRKLSKETQSKLLGYVSTLFLGAYRLQENKISRERNYFSYDIINFNNFYYSSVLLFFMKNK